VAPAVCRRLLAGGFLPGLARRKLGLMLSLLPLETLLGARLDPRAKAGTCFGAGFAEFLQPLLAPRQFIGDRQAVRCSRLICRLGLGQQFGHFGLQLPLDPADMLVGKRAVLAGIGVDLRPVQRHSPHLQHAHLAHQQRDLNEQPLDLLQKPPPECGDRVVVGSLAAMKRNATESQVARSRLRLEKTPVA
jgi:hypothetical protein